MGETVILLDENSLNRALQARAKEPRRSSKFQRSDSFQPSSEASSTTNDDSADFLLDETALNRALKSKAEKRRSRPDSRGEPRNSNYRTLPRRKSSRRPSKLKTKKGPSSSREESSRKPQSFKSESSQNSSINPTGSVNPTVTTRSVNSNNGGSLDSVSNHSVASSSRQSREHTLLPNQHSGRSKSEPRRTTNSIPLVDVTTVSHDRAPSPITVSSSAKRTFFKQTIDPASVIRPVQQISDASEDALTDAMGGFEVVERIASRFLVIGDNTSELLPFMNDVQLHQLQQEFVTLGNMQMTDDMNQLAEMLPFHYRLCASGIDLNNLITLWTDAYETVWVESGMSDSRSLVGPSRAVFNLKAMGNLYENHQRELRWDKRMKDDEKRIEEIQEQRRKRKQMRREKRRQRRSKSIDSFFSRFRGGKQKS